MRIIDLGQNSPDWLRWRMAGLGSSDAPVILHGRHFETTIDILLEEKRALYHEGKVADRRANSAMRRGKSREAAIRHKYESFIGRRAAPACVVHDTYDFLQASLDGWVDPPGVVVEIKRPGVRRDGTCDHDDALAGHVPEKYRPQLWHQCLVTGARITHYVSECDRSRYGDRSFTVVPYVPEQKDLDDLLEKEREFWQRVIMP